MPRTSQSPSVARRTRRTASMCLNKSTWGEFPRGDGTVMEALNEALRFGKEIANHPMKFQEIASGPDLFL